jgi:hypothetical protein
MYPVTFLAACQDDSTGVMGRAGNVLDPQGEQVGKLMTRLRMLAERSHFEMAGWEERLGE